MTEDRLRARNCVLQLVTSRRFNNIGLESQRRILEDTNPIAGECGLRMYIVPTLSGMARTPNTETICTPRASHNSSLASVGQASLECAQNANKRLSYSFIDPRCARFFQRYNATTMAAASSSASPVIADSGKDTKPPQLDVAEATTEDMVKLFQELVKYKQDIPGRTFLEAAAAVGRLVVKLGSAFSIASSDIQDVCIAPR